MFDTYYAKAPLHGLRLHSILFRTTKREMIEVSKMVGLRVSTHLQTPDFALKLDDVKKKAYEILQEEGIEVFTPMKQIVSVQRGKKIVSEVPMLHTLLFVHGTRDELDPVVKRINNLQYLFLKSTAHGPAIVSNDEMRYLMLASSTSSKVQYFTPEELKADKFKVGKPICINEGDYAGCIGKQFSVRGSRKKYILVELKGYVSAVVEVNPEQITVL